MPDEVERVVIGRQALAQMRKEMKKVWKTETGGVLVGSLVDGVLSVTSASGPGPRAELRLCSVLIDGVHAGQFCAAASKKSQGKIDYVGDWHCHLSLTIKPSNMDLSAMQTMADFEGSPTRTPITLIFSKYTGKLKAYLFTEKRRLRELPCSVR